LPDTRRRLRLLLCKPLRGFDGSRIGNFLDHLRQALSRQTQSLTPEPFTAFMSASGQVETNN
jgi:hypothetical protein